MSLGALADALRVLGPTDEATRARVARVLNLRWPTATTAPMATTTPATSETTGTGDEDHEPPTPHSADHDRLEERRPRHTGRGAPRFVRQPSQALLWPVPQGGQVGLEKTPRLPVPPLFAPLQASGVLVAGLAVDLADGDPDVESLVGRLARSMILSCLPRHPRPTLRLGVQVLEDRADRMQPFAADRVQLVRQLRSVVAWDRTEHLAFDRDPSAGVWPGRGGRMDQRPWTLPAPGTPILLVTAIDERSSALRRLARRARERGCPVVLLVPELPRTLPHGARAVLWDRRTNAREVGR